MSNNTSPWNKPFDMKPLQPLFGFYSEPVFFTVSDQLTHEILNI